MLNVVVPDSKEKIMQQIKSLKYALSVDTNPKDIQIHSQALIQLKKAYEAL